MSDAAGLGGRETNIRLGHGFIRAATDHEPGLDLVDATPLLDAVSSELPLKKLWPLVGQALGIPGTKVRLRRGNRCTADQVQGDRHCLIRSSTGGVLGRLELPAGTDIDDPAARCRIRAACQLLAIAIDRDRRTLPTGNPASTDALTGLPSRRQINKQIAAADQAARDHGSLSVAVMMLDIDGFGLINDAHGHDAGDALLREAAVRMRHTLRGNDTVFRLSGDQFMVVCTKIKDRRDAEVVAERLIDALGEPFDMPSERSSIRYRVSTVTASIGIALTTNEQKSAKNLRHESGVALRRAKQGGRNTYMVFDAATGAAALDRLKLESELRTAFESTWTAGQTGNADDPCHCGQFELHWQPQVDANGAAIGFEALARWSHPVRGMVPPMQFIPAAEKSGQIVAFGRWALQAACRQGAQWRDSGLSGPDGQPIRVAVNMSALEFARDDLLDHVCGVLESADLPPSALELELTESVLMNDTAAAVEKLRRLQDAGIRIAIDDFGTGYSSLAYLHQMPLNTLKIDRTFVSEINEADTATDGVLPDGSIVDKSRTAILRSVCSLAQTLQLELVAEGVETPLQSWFCTNLGAQLLQGYLFSKPIPADQVPAFVTRALTENTQSMKPMPMPRAA